MRSTSCRRTRLLAALLCATLACRNAPQPRAAQEASAPVRAAASAGAAPGAAPFAAPARPGVLAEIDDLEVVALPAPDFSGLTREQRLLAYWLAQAANAGDAIAYDQSYRHNLAIVRLLRGILTHPQAVPSSVLIRVRDFSRLVYLSHGVHDGDTGRKLRPPFSPAELRVAALSAQAAGADFGLKPGTSVEAFLRELEAPLFDVKYEGRRTDKASGGGRDPLQASAMNLYEGVTSAEVAAWHERYPLNSRLAKESGRLVEQIYRAGQPGGRVPGGPREPMVPPGMYADRLARVNASLEQAMRVTSGAQLQSLKDLEIYLRTGEPERFRLSQREWLKEAAPIDYVLGFIDTHVDPRGQKGMWEGFVGIVDLPRTALLGRLAAEAQVFEDGNPWPPEYKQKSLRAPAASALSVAAGSGDDRPQRKTGFNLPGENAERERFGSRSILLPGLEDAVSREQGERIARELAPPAVAAEVARCRSQLQFALTAFHELVGRPGGRVAAKLADAHVDPAEVLRESYGALEDARAELVGHWHAPDAKTAELGLISDAGCRSVYPHFATAEWSAPGGHLPEGDRVDDDHLRAQQLMVWWFTEQGAIAEQVISGKRYLVVLDPAKWHAAAGALLALLQDLKARGDRAQAKALLEEHASHLNPQWRDEIAARLKSLGVPRRVLGLAPVIRPVLADGKVVDAAAEPVRDLDAQILSDWAGF